MKRFFKLVSVGIVSGITLVVSHAQVLTKISRVEFFGKTNPSQIVIVGDGPIEYEKIENPADRQVVFEIKNARLANSNAGRRLDTASFNSRVSLISPYNVEGKDLVRVIVQMREFAPISTLTVGNRLFVGVDGPADPNVLASKKGEKSTTASNPTPIAQDRLSTNASADTPPAEPAATPEGRIDQFIDAQATKRYIGRHITLQVKDADIVDVFKLIGETSGFNMVIGSDVTGKLNLSLVDVPWDLALDTILTTNKLGAERTGNVLRVAQLATLTAEKQAQQAAKLAAENSAPRITRIFPLSYATGQSLLPILSRFGAGQAGVTGVGAASANRDTIVVDERTNSLIIQDTADNLERMAKIIKLLDRQTPQVQIEAKIVNAEETFSKTMAGAFGVSAEPAWGGAGGSFLTGTSNPSLPGAAGAAAAGAAGQSANNNILGMKLKIGALAGLRLGALLNLAETESTTRVVSSPRTVVLNKQPASIIQGIPVLIPVVVQTQNGTAPSVEVRSANLSLEVTPTVTNDGNVVMKLRISSDTPVPLAGGNSGISNRNLSTEVVAESGSTIAIGGIYTTSDSLSESGIPGLRKLPLIGALFGNEDKTNKRTELFIFVTPRILNEEVMDNEISTQQASALRSVGHGK